MQLLDTHVGNATEGMITVEFRGEGGDHLRENGIGRRSSGRRGNHSRKGPNGPAYDIRG